MGTNPVTILVELELADGDERPEGRLWTDDGDERAFTGWLELIGAFEELGKTGELRGKPAGDEATRSER